MKVPKANGAIRERHNKANAMFCNDHGQVRYYVYKEAENLDEGFRLTKLKKGSQYIEDDSFEFQHITTAGTYWIIGTLKMVVNTKTHSTKR